MSRSRSVSLSLCLFFFLSLSLSYTLTLTHTRTHTPYKYYSYLEIAWTDHFWTHITWHLCVCVCVCVLWVCACVCCVYVCVCCVCVRVLCLICFISIQFLILFWLVAASFCAEWQSWYTSTTRCNHVESSMRPMWHIGYHCTNCQASIAAENVGPFLCHVKKWINDFKFIECLSWMACAALLPVCC